MIHHIVMDEGAGHANGHVSPIHNGDSGIGLDNAHSACKAFKEFEVILIFLFQNYEILIIMIHDWLNSISDFSTIKHYRFNKKKIVMSIKIIGDNYQC